MCSYFHWYFDALRDNDDTFWICIRDIEAWDQRRCMYATQTSFRMIGSLKIRMVDPFENEVSYQLMAYRRLPPAKQRRVDHALFHCKREHFEAGLARPCHDLHPNAASFRANHRLHEDLENIGIHTPSHNIPSEEKFARQNVYNLSNRGNLPDHWNICHRQYT